MIRGQRYTDPHARERMEKGKCPECGGLPSHHDGGGGPRGCGLTDNGVALRLAVYAQERASAERGGR